MINREVIYERNMTGSYMKIPEGVNAGLDERLMLKGKLKGTLPVEKAYIDGGGQYWYNISGRQSLDTYCRMKQIGIEFVERLIVSICSELEILEWNLIQTNCLMLDPELVFITNSNREFIFTLYPGSNAQIEEEFQQLMEYLLTKIDHRDQAAVRAVYGIYEKTMEEGYSLVDIRNLITESRSRESGRPEEQRQQSGARPQPGPKKPEACSQPGPPEVRSQPGSLTSGREGGLGNIRQPQQGRNCQKQRESGKGQADGGHGQREMAVWQEKIQLLIENVRGRIGEICAKVQRRERAKEHESPVVYPEEEVPAPQPEVFPTVCLNGFRGVPRGILLYQGAEQLEDIRLESKVVWIGHGPEADARIVRDTISQIHARIDHDGDHYYIEDLNSTNGTCVNDEALVYKERRLLKINDIVQFADICYRFC